MSEKKKHHSFRVKLPAREVMRRLQFYADVNPFSKVDIHTIDVTGYDLIANGTPISLREDAETNETIIFIEDDGSNRNKNLATTYEQYLTRDEYLRESVNRKSEKKKHHSFRVKLPAREVMRRLQEYYGHDSFAIFMIDVTGYDLIYGGKHISLREDAATNETIIFLEDNSFFNTLDTAAEFEHLLNGYTTLLSPPTKKARQLILDTSPQDVIAVLDNLNQPDGQVTFQRKPISHVFKVWHEEKGLWLDLGLEIFQGTAPHKTHIQYTQVLSGSLIYECSKFIFWGTIIPSYLTAFIGRYNPNIWCALSLGFMGASLAGFIYTAKTTREKRKSEKQLLLWFINKIQTLGDRAKTGDFNTEDLSLFELENPLEANQSHKG